MKNHYNNLTAASLPYLHNMLINVIIEMFLNAPNRKRRPMIAIEVTCSHGSETLTLEQAEALVDSLLNNIESAKRRLQNTLLLTNGTYLSRRDLYCFFGQFVPEGAVRNRAGKLFAHLVRSAMPFNQRNEGLSPLPLDVLCGECNQPLEASETCEVLRTWHGHKYYASDREYLINVKLLIEYEDQLLPEGTHQLSGKKLEDFKVLMGSLREI